MLGNEWYYYIIMSMIGGNAFYLGFGGFVHWWHYIKNRDNAEEWKLQPNRFLSKNKQKKH